LSDGFKTDQIISAAQKSMLENRLPKYESKGYDFEIIV
jgi:hypothetical protein